MSTIKILVVEDSVTQGLLLKSILEKAGYSVIMAHNGEEGLKTVRRTFPALVIADIRMPIMGGYEMCWRIKADPELQSIPVVLLSSLSDTEDILLGLESLADLYIIKPFKEDEILRHVAGLLTADAAGHNEEPLEPLTINLYGQPYEIRSHRRQILNFLLSIYENAIHKNTQLEEIQTQLRILNEQLVEQSQALAISENRFRSLIQTAPDIIFRIDNDGYFTFVNHSIRKLGYEPEELLGQHFSVLIPPTEFEQLSRKNVMSNYKGKNTGDANTPKLFDEQRTGRRKTTGLEVRLQAKTSDKNIVGELLTLDDNNPTFEVNSSGMYQIHEETNKEVFIGTVGIIRNISQRKHLEETLIRTKEAAEAASRAKGDFLATMSHEIRTPLNAMLGMLELLSAAPIEQQYQEQANLAFNSGKTLLSLINDILDYSKIEAKQLVLAMDSFDLRTLLDDVASLLAPIAHGKKIELTTFFPQELPSLVRGDPNRLRQIFVNLIGNAIKFTPEGGVVECHGGPLSRSNGKIEFLFEIRDTGIGIAAEQRSHIFDRFTQVDQHETTRYGGTGLGLAICRHLVEIMGGQINVDANPFATSGSVFHFTVCLLEESVALSVPKQTTLQGMRFLLVACEGLQLAMLRNALLGWDVDHDEVADINASYQKIQWAAEQGHPYPLVIINQRPGANYCHEMIEYQTLDSMPRFILLVDFLDQGWDQAAKLPSPPLCLKKPFTGKRLHEAIIRLLQTDSDSKNQLRDFNSANTKTDEEVNYDANILVVDDQTANLKVAIGMLVSLGCDAKRITTATNGQQAVAKFQTGDFQLVFMDCQMPVMDGHQATRLIRDWEQQQAKPAVPIIAFTADVTIRNKEDIDAAGMSSILTKPVTLADFRTTLKQYLSTNVETDMVPVKSTGDTAHNPLYVQSIINAFTQNGLAKSDIAEIAQLLTSQFPELMDHLERDLITKDQNSTQATSHVLKGSMANTIFPELRELTRLLHEKVCACDWDGAQQQLALVRKQFAPIDQVLASLADPKQSITEEAPVS